jgi:hypothetical protein
MARIEDFSFGQAPTAQYQEAPMLQNQTSQALEGLGQNLQQTGRHILDTQSQQQIVEGSVAAKELGLTTEAYLDNQPSPFIKGPDSRDQVLSEFRRKADEIKGRATSARAAQHLQYYLDETEDRLWEHAIGVDKKLNLKSFYC